MASWTPKSRYAALVRKSKQRWDKQFGFRDNIMHSNTRRKHASKRKAALCIPTQFRSKETARRLPKLAVSAGTGNSPKR